MTNVSSKSKRSSSPFHWQLATQEDIPIIINMMLEARKEVNDGSLPEPNTERFSTLVKPLIDFKQVIFYKNNDYICGCLGVCLEQGWWFDEVQLNTAFMFVEPKFRSYQVFSAFLRLAEEYGKLNKAHSVSMNFHSPKDYKRKIRLMKRKGYQVESFTAVKPL
jgi:hypothetical protein